MKHLLSSLAILLTASPVLADEDTDVREGETPLQRDERIESQAGHYAAGVRVHAASAVGDSFNFVGLDLQGRYNVSDSIAVGARIPFAVVKPDGFAVFGGMMARASIRLGATIGAAAEVGFLKYGAVLLSQQDAPLYGDGADYELAAAVGPTVTVKAGPTYLSFHPKLVYQPGDAEAITGIQFPVAAKFRVGGLALIGAQVGLYTGDDFKLAADEGGRIATGLVADVKVSSIALQLAAGFASLLTDEAAPYTSIGKSVYATVGLMYVK
jgi:hypothetical protein